MMPMQNNPMADMGRNADSRLAAMGMGAGGADPTQSGMVPMGDANYRQAVDPQMSCGSCAHFVDPDQCAVVAGRISYEGVSDFFEPAPPAAPVDPMAGQMPAAPAPAPMPGPVM
jgi:hypothetical protein